MSRYSPGIVGHVSRYQLWIQHDSPNSASTNPVKGWYSTCKASARVVGCHAHIAAVLWFLSVPHPVESLQPALIAKDLVLIDTGNIESTDMSSEETSEDNITVLEYLCF